jgi:hypothetical protein
VTEVVHSREVFVFVGVEELRRACTSAIAAVGAVSACEKTWIGCACPGVCGSAQEDLESWALAWGSQAPHAEGVQRAPPKRVVLKGPGWVVGGLGGRDHWGGQSTRGGGGPRLLIGIRVGDG